MSGRTPSYPAAGAVSTNAWTRKNADAQSGNLFIFHDSSPIARRGTTAAGLCRKNVSGLTAGDAMQQHPSGFAWKITPSGRTQGGFFLPGRRKDSVGRADFRSECHSRGEKALRKAGYAFGTDFFSHILFHVLSGRSGYVRDSSSF